MKRILNNVGLAALLCGGMMIALPAIAAGAGDTAGASPAGQAPSGEADAAAAAGNNADAMNGQAQAQAQAGQPRTRSSRLGHRARAHADEVETTRQLNIEQAQQAQQANAAARGNVH